MARRPRTWITDMRHYLDDGMLADMPAPAMDLALHLGAIVAWVTSHAAAPQIETNVRCRTRTRAGGPRAGQGRGARTSSQRWLARGAKACPSGRRREETVLGRGCWAV